MDIRGGRAHSPDSVLKEAVPRPLRRDQRPNQRRGGQVRDFARRPRTVSAEDLRLVRGAFAVMTIPGDPGRGRVSGVEVADRWGWIIELKEGRAASLHGSSTSTKPSKPRVAGVGRGVPASLLTSSVLIHPVPPPGGTSWIVGRATSREAAGRAAHAPPASNPARPASCGERPAAPLSRAADRARPSERRPRRRG